MYQYGTSPKRDVRVNCNSYNIGGLEYDLTKAIGYLGSDFDSLNCNLNETQLQPIMFVKQREPQNATIEKEAGVLYWDGAKLKVKIKDATGAVTIKTVSLI